MLIPLPDIICDCRPKGVERISTSRDLRSWLGRRVAPGTASAGASVWPFTGTGNVRIDLRAIVRSSWGR